MNPISHSLRTGEAAGVSRLVRRICLLREQGAVGEAERLERDELPAALPQEPAGGGERGDFLQAVFSRETERIADAAALSELLLPQLLARLAVPGRGVSARPDPAVPAVPVARPAMAAGSPAIPDLLDAMLAAERHNRRPQAPSMRGARPTT